MPSETRPLKAGDKLLPNSFGVAGVDAWDYLETAGSKRLGILRNVQFDHENNSVSGVRYVFESVKGDIGCKWRKGSSPGCWEADLGTQRNPQSMKSYTSLASFSNRIRAKYEKNGRIEKDDDDLRQLDDFIQGILQVVSVLHREKQLVGALTPDNAISFFDENANRHTLLPDAGFRWHGAPPGPAWIKKLDVDWAELWLPQACDTFHSREWSPAAEREDLLLLARILLWILTGSVENSEHRIRNEFSDRVRSSEGEVPASCWAALYQAVATSDELRAAGLSPIRTVAQLAEKLKLSPLSEHFLFIKPPKKKWFSWKIACGTLIMSVMLGGAGFLVMNPDVTNRIISSIIPDPPTRNRLCPDCAHPSAFLPLLDELVPVVDTLESRLNTTAQAGSSLYDKSLRDGLAELSAFKTLIAKLKEAQATSLGDKAQEQACLEKVEAQYTQLLNGLGESFFASAQNGNIVDQQGIGRKLVEAFDENQNVNLEKPEWYDMIRTYFLD